MAGIGRWTLSALARLSRNHLWSAQRLIEAPHYCHSSASEFHNKRVPNHHSGKQLCLYLLFGERVYQQQGAALARNKAAIIAKKPHPFTNEDPKQGHLHCYFVAGLAAAFRLVLSAQTYSNAGQPSIIYNAIWSTRMTMWTMARGDLASIEEANAIAPCFKRLQPSLCYTPSPWAMK